MAPKQTLSPSDSFMDTENFAFSMAARNRFKSSPAGANKASQYVTDSDDSTLSRITRLTEQAQESAPSTEMAAAAGGTHPRSEMQTHNVNDSQEANAECPSSERESRTEWHEHATSRKKSRQEDDTGRPGDEYIVIMLDDSEQLHDAATFGVGSEMTAALQDNSSDDRSSTFRRPRRSRGSFKSQRANRKEKHFLAMEHLSKFENMFIE